MGLLEQLLAQYQATRETIDDTHRRASAGEIPYDEAHATVLAQIDIRVDLQEQADNLDYGLLWDSEGRYIG